MISDLSQKTIHVKWFFLVKFLWCRILKQVVHMLLVEICCENYRLVTKYIFFLMKSLTCRLYRCLFAALRQGGRQAWKAGKKSKLIIDLLQRIAMPNDSFSLGSLNARISDVGRKNSQNKKTTNEREYLCMSKTKNKKSLNCLARSRKNSFDVKNCKIFPFAIFCFEIRKQLGFLMFCFRHCEIVIRITQFGQELNYNSPFAKPMFSAFFVSIFSSLLCFFGSLPNYF